MKRLLILLALVALLVVPAMADVDSFYITTVYNSPTHYLIDYGESTTTQVYNYSINSSVAMGATQAWLFLGSNNTHTVYLLDSHDTTAFPADLARNFSVTTIGHYRYYYLVLTEGFANSAAILNLTLYANETSTLYTASPSMIFTTGSGSGGSGDIGAGLLVGAVSGLIGGILAIRISKRDEKQS